MQDSEYKVELLQVQFLYGHRMFIALVRPTRSAPNSNTHRLPEKFGEIIIVKKGGLNAVFDSQIENYPSQGAQKAISTATEFC